MKINLRKLAMWWTESEAAADQFTNFVLEHAMICGDDNFISDFARVLRESGMYTVPPLSELENLLSLAGLNCTFDGRQTRVSI